jgi:hypothetical protein
MDLWEGKTYNDVSHEIPTSLKEWQERSNLTWNVSLWLPLPEMRGLIDVGNYGKSNAKFGIEDQPRWDTECQ